MTTEQRDLLTALDARASSRADRAFLDSFATLFRVEEIFARYCREGNRPSREEAKAWLESLGWQPAPLAHLLRKWGYGE